MTDPYFYPPGARGVDFPAIMAYLKSHPVARRPECETGYLAPTVLKLEP